MSEAEGAPWERFPRAMRRNALKIWGHEDAVHKVDADHWLVLSLNTPSRRVRVYRRDDEIRCSSDKRIKGGEAHGSHYNQDRPCAHIVVILLYEGILEQPNTADTVWTKGKQGRKQGVEAEAWRRVPVRAPQIMAKLLRQGLPVIAPEAPRGNGRPPASTFAVAYQSVMRCLERGSLYAAQGRMETATHRENNPSGAVSVATICRFLTGKSRVEPELVLEKLLALSTGPARPYESVFHPDGTGLTEQRFSAYFDERYAKDKRKQIEGGARKHHWTYTEILWTYRYTMVASLYAQQGPFGEAPWLLPLLDRARLMLQPTELGADKAYNATYIDAYLAEHGIDSQIKVKDNANAGQQSNARVKAYKRRLERAQIDPEGFAARANRRNNAETGNHAFKAILGDQIYSKDARAQRNEILCMAIAHNLTRLVYLEVERGIEVDFAEGAQALGAAKWETLEALYKRHRDALPAWQRAHDKQRPEWAA